MMYIKTYIIQNNYTWLHPGDVQEKNFSFSASSPDGGSFDVDIAKPVTPRI